MKPFWFVWNEHGGWPTHRHASRHEAEREAERLARKAPGQRFIVLCAESAVMKSDLIWERTPALDEEIPF